MPYGYSLSTIGLSTNFVKKNRKFTRNWRHKSSTRQQRLSLPKWHLVPLIFFCIFFIYLHLAKKFRSLNSIHTHFLHPFALMAPVLLNYIVLGVYLVSLALHAVAEAMCLWLLYCIFFRNKVLRHELSAFNKLNLACWALMLGTDMPHICVMLYAWRAESKLAGYGSFVRVEWKFSKQKILKWNLRKIVVKYFWRNKIVYCNKFKNYYFI